MTGVFLVGSHARGIAASESDVDLVVLTTEPKRYLDDFTWVSAFGDFKSIRHEDWGMVQSIRVFYEDGHEIEYGITTPALASHPIPGMPDRGSLCGKKLLRADPRMRADRRAYAVDNPSLRQRRLVCRHRHFLEQAQRHLSRPRHKRETPGCGSGSGEEEHSSSETGGSAGFHGVNQDALAN